MLAGRFGGIADESQMRSGDGNSRRNYSIEAAPVRVWGIFEKIVLIDTRLTPNARGRLSRGALSERFERFLGSRY